ncbi:PLP-dependent aminotransferase family protein [Pseudomonas soli]|uniref:GntR family transcriptional regulator / MocR family aminotransferase n=1 Tax=Pseudomonas soli TaxID=1306993 RepID=A0A1H9JK64_9PSED|nr:PLP-dependent aminotransferase family protein [Pseudomonas soli]MDT3712561.1 PLP-dependent aminotransferase family protein [Pseudomonas soli]MDT3729898.1 PLP-dependent aminotransferase family protein [Pseudomonas soli]NBK41819.1 PLP-dependent aminotransferase family protein [Pseudomonas soli]WJO24328.1 PLP-dependent aminotransferase family protein [Pseudomonas soli]SEQ87226.1 GntR family transcriptional regulator / MocR family aminotransferase [Pseudomonas soli]
MELHIRLEGRKGLAEQLYRQLRAGIDSGHLAAGTQLPPTRLLAEQLGVSRKTVAEAYSRLTYDNLLSGVVGRGTFISPRHTLRQGDSEHIPLAAADTLERWRQRATVLAQRALDAPSRYDFIGGASSKSQFPYDQWRSCMNYALRRSQRHPERQFSAQGLPELREAITHHIAFTRGIQCAPSDVLVCNGAQQALDLIARVLVEPGCKVAMEDPGYPPARQLFQALGARMQSVPVDDQGLCVEQIEDGTRLIYVTPSHQFPLGMPMAAPRREALLARAAELGALIIEDDYDCEFRYQGPAAEALQRMDRHGLVAYVGTFSKTLLPELRLGYAVLPPAVLQAACVAKHLSDWHSPTLQQWALARFLAEGHLNKHIRRCHEVYSARRERILARLGGDLAPWFDAVPASAGFHLSALAKPGVDVELLISLARKVEVGLYSLAPFFSEAPVRPGLLLGFGAIELLDIDPALDRVADTLQRLS